MQDRNVQRILRPSNVPEHSLPEFPWLTRAECTVRVRLTGMGLRSLCNSIFSGYSRIQMSGFTREFLLFENKRPSCLDSRPNRERFQTAFEQGVVAISKDIETKDMTSKSAGSVCRV